MHVRVHRSRQFAAVHWSDTKGVMFLSTAEDPIAQECETKRNKDGANVSVFSIPVQLMYSENMKVVDVHDQMRQSCSCSIH